MMLKLGKYVFSIHTAAYQSLTRIYQYRWQRQDRLMREPAYQYLGPGDVTVKIDGVIYPHFKGGLRQIDWMQLEASQGKPLMLVDGTGRIYGKWCIQEIQETNQRFASFGRPMKIEFRLGLIQYGLDKP